MIDYLFHYYEKKSGPFSNLSSVPLPDAQKILNGLKSERQTMASQRYDGYLQRRHELESIARAIFIEKGGKPKNEYRNSSALFSVFPGLFALYGLRSYQIFDMHRTWSRFSATEARTYH